MIQVLLLLFTSFVFAKVTPEFFLDSYYTYDFNEPLKKRQFTTQAVRHDQPAVNLIYGGLKVEKQKLRGRLALQAGDSVERNAALEPGKARYIQESYLGVKLGPRTWLDGGVYLGHIGMESWISKENYTYTRSLILDYVPYYAAGLRLEHQLAEESAIQFHLLQGWQNISETNEAKAFGFQFKKRKFIYNNFFGDEQVYPEQKDRFRNYHNFIFHFDLNEAWKLLSALDVGFQAQQENNGVNAWAGTSVTLDQTLNESQSLAYRVEYYLDPHQSNVQTGTGNGFEVIGASVNFDQKLAEKFYWRTELRGFYSKDEIYPQRNRTSSHFDSFIVSNFSLWY